MFASTSSRTRRNGAVLPSHHAGRSGQRKPRRAAAVAKLCVLLAAVAALAWLGKTLLWRSMRHRSPDRQPRLLAEVAEAPCIGESCQPGKVHPFAADVAARAHARLQHASAAEGLYTMSLHDTDGTSYALSQYAGKVSLVVNVASQCGYTESNYRGLQQLYEKYQNQGFEVLAFPCNQFGGQEPGSLEEVRAFAAENFHITFPIFPKIEVNGANEHAVFTYLKQNLPSRTGADMLLSWNFNKFLVNRHGQPVKHYQSAFNELELESDIQHELGTPVLDYAASA